MRSVIGTPVVGVPVGEPFVEVVSNGFYDRKMWRFLIYLVILLDDDPVFRDATESNTFVGYPRDGTSSVVYSLDSNAVLRVLDG